MEIEQKFFVFVGILEKGIEMHYSSAISQLTCRIYTSPFTIEGSTFNILRLKVDFHSHVTGHMHDNCCHASGLIL